MCVVSRVQCAAKQWNSRTIHILRIVVCVCAGCWIFCSIPPHHLPLPIRWPCSCSHSYYYYWSHFRISQIHARYRQNTNPDYVMLLLVLLLLLPCIKYVYHYPLPIGRAHTLPQTQCRNLSLWRCASVARTKPNTPGICRHFAAWEHGKMMCSVLYVAHCVYSVYICRFALMPKNWTFFSYLSSLCSLPTGMNSIDLFSSLCERDAFFGMACNARIYIIQCSDNDMAFTRCHIRYEKQHGKRTKKEAHRDEEKKLHKVLEWVLFEWECVLVCPVHEKDAFGTSSGSSRHVTRENPCEWMRNKENRE